MYVIFPADEVVYLSYGRLIYVPSVPRTAVPQPLQDPASAPQPSSGHSTGSCPSPSIPSTSSSRSFRSTASAPFSNLQPEKAHGEVKKSSSNKELASSKETKQKDTLKVPKLKVPPGKDKRLSYSDFLPVHKCLKPEQQGKRSKTPQVDFDNLFSRREPSHSPEPQRRVTPEKSPTRRKQFFGSAQKPEARVKRTADFGFGMASSESPFRDLTHPHYNELIKGHNGVTFKLIRT
ncbi:PREDICTED: serine/arginine repetitive matrix protein 2-like, partial [Nicrophorus vespilloides]|uniref:Serine/arginine repetitive matrix protein 2-like n=1 Tax=Nicrophorus vespilloides TaxID=110193 RepID=A0ABM1NJD2_NICVS